MGDLIHIKRVTVLLAFLALLSGLLRAQGEPGSRSAADVQRDLGSRPNEVLDFFDPQPGWRIIDLFAGDGYYSELLHQRVGPRGRIYLHNSQATQPNPRLLRQRLQPTSQGPSRLPRVEVLVQDVDQIALPHGELDMVLIARVYHDAYFRGPGWSVGPDALLTAAHRLLKPGGVLAVIDHLAPPGSGTAYVQAKHRIDEEFALADITRRGFRWEASSHVLKDFDDDLEAPVFDPRIRGQTKRFVMRFIKE